jgi:hypothetical protein
MDQVALDQLAARASAAGFSSIAEYAENLEGAIGWYVNERERYFRGEATAGLGHAFERLRVLSRSGS